MHSPPQFFILRGDAPLCGSLVELKRYRSMAHLILEVCTCVFKLWQNLKFTESYMPTFENLHGGFYARRHFPRRKFRGVLSCKWFA